MATDIGRGGTDDMADKPDNNMLRYAGLATQLMAMLLAAVWLGYKGDHWIGWKFPLLLILLPVLILGVSLWRLINELNKPKK